jgi:hypothetical protein
MKHTVRINLGDLKSAVLASICPLAVATLAGRRVLTVAKIPMTDRASSGLPFKERN